MSEGLRQQPRNYEVNDFYVEMLEREQPGTSLPPRRCYDCIPHIELDLAPCLGRDSRTILHCLKT